MLDDLHDRVHAAVLGLRGTPGLPAAARRARRRAPAPGSGADGGRVRDPGDLGGIDRRSATGRRVDYTLPALADRALAALGDAVDDLLQ